MTLTHARASYGNDVQKTLEATLCYVVLVSVRGVVIFHTSCARHFSEANLARLYKASVGKSVAKTSVKVINTSLYFKYASKYRITVCR